MESNNEGQYSKQNDHLTTLPTEPAIPLTQSIPNPTEPEENLPTPSEQISDLRDKIEALSQMKRKLGGKQRKRLRELNTELTSLENPLTAIVDLAPENKTVIQGRFVNSDEIPSRQRLPLWWENKEVQ